MHDGALGRIRRPYGGTRARHRPPAVAIVLGFLLLLLGVFDFARTGRGDIATKAWSLDYDINLIAAKRLVDHDDIYSPRGSVATGQRSGRPAHEVRVPGSLHELHRDARRRADARTVPRVRRTTTGTAPLPVLALIEMIAAILLVAWALRPGRPAAGRTLRAGRAVLGLPHGQVVSPWARETAW